MRKSLITVLMLSASLSGYSKIELPDIIGNNMVLQQKADAKIWGWATPGSLVTVSGSWNASKKVTAKADSKGRWEVMLPTPAASFTPYSVTIKGDGSDLILDNVLSGEVWFCSGQSNMEMPLRGFGFQPVEGAGEAIAYSGRYPGIRVARVPKGRSYTPQDRTPGPWNVSQPSTAREFTALGYFFARSLSDILGVPVGIIDCSYGGSKIEGWQSREQLAKYPEWNVDKEEADSTLQDYERINIMYNSMLHPLIGYTVKGFLWNQGESNVGREKTYPYHQKDMVEGWRVKWGLGELPFYFVEIPGWDYGNPDGTGAALFRESQHKAAELIPNSAIISTSDLVYPFEVNDIHARKKREIGERLAFMAAAKTYGIEGMPVDYPRFKSMKVEGDKAIITLTNPWDGITPYRNLEGFEAAGADRVFHPAMANVNLQTMDIEVTCPEAGTIEAVRYNFKNFAVGKIHNSLGLPLVPFRTDDWEQ